MSVPGELMNAKVCDLVGDDGDWDWDLITWLTNEIKV